MQITPGTSRGLTLYQPWAELIACGQKRIETRGRLTKWRGILLIHASKRLPKAKRHEIDHAIAWSVLRERGDMRRYEELPESAVVAVAEIVAAVRITRLGWVGDVQVLHPENLCGDFGVGRCAYLLSNVRRLNRPVPARGARGEWFPSLELCERVMRELPPEQLAGEAGFDDLHARVAP